MQRSARRRRSLKPCRSNQIRNPPTKRCVKKTGSIGRRLLGHSPRRASPAARRRSPKPCYAYQIRNPASGRCVKKTGSIGRRLLGNYGSSPLRRAFSPVARKPCKAHQLRNPDTGRCVKKNGAIGQRILQRRTSPYYHDAGSNSLEHVAHNSTHFEPFWRPNAQPGQVRFNFNPEIRNIEQVDELALQRHAQRLNDKLNKAAYAGDLNTVREMLSIGADSVNEALAQAMYENKTDVVRYLLQKNARFVPPSDRFALGVAVRANNIDMVNLILQSGSFTPESVVEAKEEAIERGYADIAALF